MTSREPQQVALGELDASHRGQRITIETGNGDKLAGRISEVRHYSSDRRAMTQVLVVWWSDLQFVVDLDSETPATVVPHR